MLARSLLLSRYTSRLFSPVGNSPVLGISSLRPFRDERMICSSNLSNQAPVPYSFPEAYVGLSYLPLYQRERTDDARCKDNPITTTFLTKSTLPTANAERERILFAPKLMDRLHQALRSRHFSQPTERAYGLWVRQFIHFHNICHPAKMRSSPVFLYSLTYSLRNAHEVSAFLPFGCSSFVHSMLR
jgi:hypothetical protein